jgi:adenylate kinase family enzyme
LTKRADDNPTTFRNRLEASDKHAKPLLDFYAEQGLNIVTLDQIVTFLLKNHVLLFQQVS